MKILLVCRGNVARSQMAEELLKREGFEVKSAGTKLSGPEEPLGNIAHLLEHVLQVMKEIGIDMVQNVRNNVTSEMAEWADRIILVVDENDPIPDYLMNNPKAITWDVLDPKGQSLEFTRQCRDQIIGLVKDFVLEQAQG
jgi:protein-tyrosine-phosphatase